MTNWTDKYIGIPFVAQGRTMQGVDCCGLCILALYQERGIKVWDCADVYQVKEMHTRAGLARLDEILRRHLAVWKTVSLREVQPFDVVLYRHHGVETHCALVVDAKHVLNVEERHPVHMAPLNLPGYAIAGVYRHE